MPDIIGSFYLKKVASDKLLGEFTNNILFTVSSESCELIEAGDAPFLGKYSSQWYIADKRYSAILVVSFIEHAENRNTKYRLSWFMDEKLVYEGEAMLVDDMLIGHYVSFL
ncbi:hypothetical protein E0W68_13615 [Flavobacterium salilacus subsp. salilacus]|uniref:hypothetical protein n=1 Tax=Flavobacterium TaxID=237 RepID=UPI0010757D08|nr:MULTISPECIES: hypothetical protein [Flavobacterium]KAF2514506.1 hypothetical protein E0W68_13615 [Flavobacterium salilacus subsp. salilacus]MBE1615935.1 hypothetical protein [Flavobacterium sp. SaA2.13]